MRLSVIVPVYNEINTIARVLAELHDIDVGVEKEIIVVEAVRVRFEECMRNDPRAFELSPEQMDALTALVITGGGEGMASPSPLRKGRGLG